jgi:hypothetical protein
MNNQLTQIDNETLQTIRVSLLLWIMNHWKYRNVFRSEIRKNVKALRTMRNSLAVYQEKAFWAK